MKPRKSTPSRLASFPRMRRLARARPASFIYRSGLDAPSPSTIRKAIAKVCRKFQARTHELFPGSPISLRLRLSNRTRSCTPSTKRNRLRHRPPTVAGCRSEFLRYASPSYDHRVSARSRFRRGSKWNWLEAHREGTRTLFQPPFGYYDKNYPGWQPSSAATDKTKS